MTPGTSVTIISPLIGHMGERYVNSRKKQMYTAKRGTYMGQRDGMRIVQHSDGGQTHITLGGETRLTTKKVDISPCGLLE